MIYRRVGESGLQVSVLSFGTASIGKFSRREAATVFGRAIELGINYIDTAEAYLSGEAEIATGRVIRDLGLRRQKIVLATKCLTYGWSDPEAGPNELRTLNRKYILHAIDRSLRRLDTDFVDIYYCHQFDPNTPISETVRAMSDVVQSGKARYWATSNWDAEQIATACAFADRYGFHRPICEQAEYNVLHRGFVENELQQPLRKLGVGLAAWGPLAGGILTGKYAASIPDSSRATDAGCITSGVAELLTERTRNDIVKRLMSIAADIGCDVTCLALAWCLRDPLFATVVSAASSLAQVEQSARMVDVIAKITPEVSERIREAVGSYDQSYVPQHLADG